MTAFEWAVRATRGDRNYQEDAAAFWPGAATFDCDLDLPPRDGDMLSAVLADGMGGHAGGALASQTACRTFLAGIAGLVELDRTIGLPERDDDDVGDDNDPGAVGQSTHDDDVTTITVAQTSTVRDLVAALHGANEDIAVCAAAEPALAGMGTTLVGIALANRELEWVSVGDSPLYLYRNGDVALLNEDHSLAPALDQMAAEGIITEAAARNDPRRHMLRSALTGDELELIDVSRRPLPLGAGDIIVLASDGIHTLEEDEIARVVTAYAGDGAAAIAEALIRTIENQQALHQDNATIMIVRVL